MKLGVREVSELTGGGQRDVFQCDLDEAAFLGRGATMDCCQQARCQVQSGCQVPRWDRVVHRGCFCRVARQQWEPSAGLDGVIHRSAAVVFAHQLHVHQIGATLTQFGIHELGVPIRVADQDAAVRAAGGHQICNEFLTFGAFEVNRDG